MDEAREQIYKFIQDQHDKLVTARESLISRYGNIRLLAGLLLTVFSFSISINAKSIEAAKDFVQLSIAISPLIVLAIALYYVIRALITIPGLVGNIDIYIPAPDENERKGFEKGLQDSELDANNILIILSGNYLNAIEMNRRELMNAQIELERCGYFMKRGLFATIAFLLLTLLSNITVVGVLSRLK